MRYYNTLRSHRDHLRHTQWEVAKAIDMTQDRYAGIERGRMEPSYDEARRLGAYFAVEPDALFPAAAATAADNASTAA